jgi:hypothetical protein
MPHLLVDNPVDAGGPFTNLVLPGSGSISNSQCTTSGTGATASGSGNTLTLTLPIAFSHSFAGANIFYLAARNSTLNSGWQAVGTVAVPQRGCHLVSRFVNALGYYSGAEPASTRAEHVSGGSNLAERAGRLEKAGCGVKFYLICRGWQAKAPASPSRLSRVPWRVSPRLDTVSTQSGVFSLVTFSTAEVTSATVRSNSSSVE